MKPEFIHNPRNLTYEDALDDQHKDWAVPAICPECQEQKHECDCSSISTTNEPVLTIIDSPHNK